MSKQWTTPQTATVKFDVALNERGNIAQTGQDAAGKKSYSVNNIKTDATFTDTTKVYSAFVTGLAGGRYDENSGEKTDKYKVTDVEDGEGE